MYIKIRKLVCIFASPIKSDFMFQLRKQTIVFPPVHLANKDGLLAYGGDLSVERLILAYQQGIFPWYNKGEGILWWSPNPRMVLFPSEVKISKSMRSLMRKNKYTITENKAFEEVIYNCSIARRKGEKGTWLSEEMIKSYTALYHKGKAFSIEVWNAQNILVGGLYGVINNKNVLSGESMFNFESNTSKLALIYLAQKAEKEKYKVIDCQIYTDHLASLGAREIPREMFISFLDEE